MNLDESYGIDAFLIKSCPAVVQASQIRIRIDLSVCQTEMTTMLTSLILL
jgi:hypothetical protein